MSLFSQQLPGLSLGLFRIMFGVLWLHAAVQKAPWVINPQRRVLTGSCKPGWRKLPGATRALDGCFYAACKESGQQRKGVKSRLAYVILFALVMRPVARGSLQRHPCGQCSWMAVPQRG